MKYTINKVAQTAGVTTRTLHHYDEIGLLRPSRNEENEYRYYGQEDLLRLQQILIYKDLGFPLTTIKEILDNKEFNYIKALQEHKKALRGQKERLEEIVQTIDKTLKRLKKGEDMNAQDLYGGLTKQQMEEYQKEAEERWGNTDAYKESVARVKAMGKEGLQKIFEESQTILQELKGVMHLPVESEEVQKVVEKHRNNIGHFFTMTDEIYRGLANMYINDPRFTATYDKVAPGLAKFLSGAMLASLQEKIKVK